MTLPSFLIHCIPYPRRLEGSMVGDGRGHPEARATWQVYLQLGLRPQVSGPSASVAWSNQRVEPQGIIPRLAPGTQTKNGPHFLSSGVMISKSRCNFYKHYLITLKSRLSLRTYGSSSKINSCLIIYLLFSSICLSFSFCYRLKVLLQFNNKVQ